MIILFILGLLLGVFAVIFTLQNTAIVTVAFFSWQLTGSLSVTLALAFLSGALIALLMFLPSSIRNSLSWRKLKKSNLVLEDKLEKQKELTTFAKVVPPTREDIEKIEDGVIDHENNIH